MKQMKRTIAVILILMMGLTILAGCGGAKLSGKYELISITEDGETELWVDWVKEMKEYTDEDTTVDESVYEAYIEFIDGEKCKMVMAGDATEGTYKVDGKNVEINIDDETAKGTIDGKKITIEIYEGSVMLFEKK